MRPSSFMQPMQPHRLARLPQSHPRPSPTDGLTRYKRPEISASQSDEAPRNELGLGAKDKFSAVLQQDGHAKGWYAEVSGAVYAWNVVKTPTTGERPAGVFAQSFRILTLAYPQTIVSQLYASHACMRL